MARYVTIIVAVSLLALSGCLTYPYGGYYGGYGGYGGYPSYGTQYGYPYGSPQYGAPYCPPSSGYGYSYDPYGSQYGYGYGYAPGVVVPAPAPPVVMENPYSGDTGDSTWNTREGRRRRMLSRDGWTRHGSTPTQGDSQTDTGTSQTPASGSASPTAETKQQALQAAMERRQQMMANRNTQTGGVTTNSGAADQFQRSRLSGAGYARQNAGTWQGGNRNPSAQTLMGSRQQMRTNAGTASVSPQMRQGAMIRQPSRATAAPRMGSSPAASSRPVMSGTPRMANRAQVGQARPQVSGQARGAARQAGQRVQ